MAERDIGVLLIVNVNIARQNSMYRNKKCHLQHFICCLIRKWGIAIETLVPRYYITQENYELDF